MRVFIRVEFVVRLDRSVHLEVLGEQGLENAMTRNVLLVEKKKSVSNCKSGTNGTFYSV